MTIQVEKIIHAFIGNGITATLTRRQDIESPFYFDILWANGESGLDYGVQIDAKAAASLIEALNLVLAESEKK